MSGARSGAARVWASPLWVHTLVLVAFLLVGLALIAPHVAFSSDEGVAVIQARMLRDGEGWLYRYPLAGIDPHGAARPFEHGDVGTKGVAPYAKHPLYPLLLAGLDAAGGLGAMLAIGLAGTVLAALLAALLARRLDPRFDRVTLWLVGVGSPLFFDAYVVLAHTLAAAATAGAFLLAVIILQPGAGRTRRIWCLIGMAVGLLLATQLRTESVLLGPALAVAVGVLAGLRRLPVRRAVAVGVTAVGACAAAWSIDHLAARAILGSSLGGVPNSGGIGGLHGRWDAAHTTLLQASYTGPVTGDLLLELGALSLLIGAAVLHWRGQRRQAVVTALALAVACYVGHLLVGPGGPIPGLVLAFPAGWFLVWVAGRRTLADVAGPLLIITSGLVLMAVLATEYSIGGGIEWGGRYFSAVIPLAAPALVVGAWPTVRARGPDLARVVVALMVVVTLTSSVIALQGLRHYHQDTAQVLDQIRAQAARAGTSGGLAKPVVLASNRLLPQIDYRDFDDYDWVAVDPGDVTRFAAKLDELGVTRMVLASSEQAADLRNLPGWRVVHPPEGDSIVDVSIIERTP